MSSQALQNEGHIKMTVLLSTSSLMSMASKELSQVPNRQSLLRLPPALNATLESAASTTARLLGKGSAANLPLLAPAPPSSPSPQFSKADFAQRLQSTTTSMQSAEPVPGARPWLTAYIAAAQAASSKPEGYEQVKSLLTHALAQTGTPAPPPPLPSNSRELWVSPGGSGCTALSPGPRVLHLPKSTSEYVDIRVEQFYANSVE
ncbi:hypothetical protein BU24DRAFT_458342 [Aaosphaeria arxii CBS 175.79]|uniref:Uncharacterized protein n=1 Tax=Aaosphaeria arxii CBS 175.79 TaxID=1450172 RepID=A0A6A5Y073_9PLEO|nr:uncharacterized protein BU24DRAFT_458342 [Aaosphaeria arxii CBS 175.79]KAF2018583.1 hypothetical protein BU24DRAFT_458342 [Aaosphaeria arxii CBS 175.79]